MDAKLLESQMGSEIRSCNQQAHKSMLEGEEQLGKLLSNIVSLCWFKFEVFMTLLRNMAYNLIIFIF